MVDWIGWCATGLFVLSYFCTRPALLRGVQGLAALVWVGYGLLIDAAPVVLANVLVAAVALYSARYRAAPDSPDAAS